MALDTTVDSNVLSYPVLVIMKEHSAVIERGRASLGTSGEVELALNHRVRQSLALGGQARRSQPLDVGRGRARP